MHYKTIKFNIKIPLNIQNFHFCGALCAKCLILRIARRNFLAFSNFAPPNPKNRSTPLTDLCMYACVCVCVCVCVFVCECMCVCGVRVCVLI